MLHILIKSKRDFKKANHAPTQKLELKNLTIGSRYFYREILL